MIISQLWELPNVCLAKVIIILYFGPISDKLQYAVMFFLAFRAP